MNSEDRNSQIETETEEVTPLDAATEEAVAMAEPPVPPLKRFVGTAFEYLELFVWSIFAVLVVFSFGVRLCQVDGESMENTLQNGEKLLLLSAYTPKQDDIVVFQLVDEQEKTFVKRVIATGGQAVVIDTNTNAITVDGVPYADSHAVLKNLNDQEIGFYYTALFGEGYNPITGIYKATVPEGHVFLMGDNRNNSKDSRNPSVGFVDERCVLGKVILRLSPFTVFS